MQFYSDLGITDTQVRMMPSRFGDVTDGRRQQHRVRPAWRFKCTPEPTVSHFRKKCPACSVYPLKTVIGDYLKEEKEKNKQQGGNDKK